MRSFADSDTFGTVEHLASLVWAFNLTFRLLTFYITNSVLWFGARSVTFGRFAHRIADCRAVWVIAFPRALRVALRSHKGA
jgi:hypothetical protein